MADDILLKIETSPIELEVSEVGAQGPPGSGGAASGTPPISVVAGVVSHDNSGVAPGTYGRVTVDQKGHVSAGAPEAIGDVTGLQAALDARVQLAGQLGGSAAVPDVRGVRESGGNLLSMGSVGNGEVLKRSGSTIVGVPVGAADGVASLDSGGKVPSAQLPLLALTDVFTVASQAAQLALTAQEGDVAIRTDLNKSFIHNGGSAGTMADWSELLTPTDAVLSIFGRVGAVVAQIGDYSFSQISGTVATGQIADDAVSNAKLANMPVDTIKGRATAGTGDPEDIACTAAGRALLDDANAAAQRGTLDVPSNAEAILDTIIDAKGDLIVGTAADTPARKAVGSDGQQLYADAAQSDGLLYQYPPITAAKTANYTATVKDQTVLGDTSGGTHTTTLPDATTCSGKVLRFVKVGTGTTAWVIDGNGAQTIDVGQAAAVTGFSLYLRGEIVALQSDGTGWVMIEARCPAASAKVKHSANQQTTTGVNLKLTYDTEVSDPYGMHDTGTNPERITAKVPGFWHPVLHVEFAVNATGARQLQILKGGATNVVLVNQQAVSTASTTTRLGVPPSEVELAYDEYLESFALQSSGGNLNVTGAQDYTPIFGMQLIRRTY